jgi:hypothetical protein
MKTKVFWFFFSKKNTLPSPYAKAKQGKDDSSFLKKRSKRLLVSAPFPISGPGLENAAFAVGWVSEAPPIILPASSRRVEEIHQRNAQPASFHGPAWHLA